MNTRLSSEPAQSHTSQNPTDLLEGLDIHRPFLSPDAFSKFSSLAIDYLGEFPAETIPQATDNTPEGLMASETFNQQDQSIQDNEALTQFGLEQVEGRLRDVMIGRISEEFKACGLEAESPELDTAIEDALKRARFSLAAKQATFKELMDYFGSQTEAISEDLIERMTTALQDMSDNITNSPIMPEEPVKKIFGNKARAATYEAWLNSKDTLVEKQRLPTRQEVLADHFKSASAAFRRALYGSRPMILNRGFDSDNTSDIDSFQRRHYDELGQYLIALSPTEWASNMMREFVDDVLYGQTQTAQLLDEAVRGTYKEDSRGYRKNSGASWQKTNYSHKTDYTTTKASWTKTDKPKEAEPEAVKDLAGAALTTYQDMVRFIDAELPNLTQTDGWRGKALDICAGILANKEIQITDESLGSKILVKRIIRKIVAKLHPDAESGNEQLCKEFSVLLNRLNNKPWSNLEKQ